MGTKITFADGLPHDNVRLANGVEAAVALDPKQRYLGGELLVIDNVPWSGDLEVIRTALVPKHRPFKAPFSEAEPAPEVQAEISKILADIDLLFSLLYPSFKPGQKRSSFRPMVTGPEPIHFDTYGGPGLVTAYMNVSNEPRVYNIGPSFMQLLRNKPKLMREVVAACPDPADYSYQIRSRTARDERPIDSKTPRHRVELAPGAIWFFDAKTVSHEVVYGAGALGVSWEVPKSGVKTQHTWVKELL